VPGHVLRPARREAHDRMRRVPSSTRRRSHGEGERLDRPRDAVPGHRERVTGSLANVPLRTQVHSRTRTHEIATALPSRWWTEIPKSLRDRLRGAVRVVRASFFHRADPYVPKSRPTWLLKEQHISLLQGGSEPQIGKRRRVCLLLGRAAVNCFESRFRQKPMKVNRDRLRATGGRRNFRTNLHRKSV
jgi:hypothetical protein